jgi:3-hydroxyisobutyrate dehydrogenase
MNGQGQAASVAVIGLGQMGLGMARTLAGKGFAVCGFDPDPAREAMAREAGVTVDRLRGEILARSPVVIASLPQAAHVAALVEDADGFLVRASRGSVLIDTSTSQADVSRRLAALCADHGLGFLDAPVSGGPAGAASGALTMMIGGSDTDLAAAMPVLEAISARRFHVGGPGAGNVAKLVNNLLVGAHLIAAGEAAAIAQKSGVPLGKLLEVVNAASGRSAITEVNMPRWIANGAYDSGFTMGLMRKDVRLAAALMREAGVEGPLLAHAAELWAASAEALADGEDFNRVVTLSGMEPSS